MPEPRNLRSVHSLHSLRFRLLLTMSVVVVVAVGTVALVTNRSTTSEFERYVRDDIERDQRIVSELLHSYKGDQSPEGLRALVKKLSQSSGERLIIANGAGRVLADSEEKMVGENIRWPVPLPAQRAGLPGEVAVEISSLLTPTLVEISEVSVPFTSAGSIGTAIFQTVPLTSTLEAPLTTTTTYEGVAPDQIEWVPLFLPLARLPGQPPAGEAGASGASVGGSPDADLIVARIAQPNGATEEGFLSSVNRQLLLAVAAAGLAALLLTWLLSRRILAPVEALTAAATRMEKGDLSQRVEVSSKDEIGELAHAFNSMAQGLSDLERLRRNMVTDIAHELRTPLSNLRGYLEAMRDGVAKPDPALIASLHEEALLLARLVEDLQELELAEAGQLRLDRRKVCPAEMIEQAVVASRPAASSKGVGLSVDLPPELPSVEADPKRIGQVLRNLLDNAITHTAPGGQVCATARRSGNELEISVRDTGTGIPAEQLPYLFERFYRADPSRARSTGGSGLGLSIVKQLVQMHGGRVWVESREGVGSTFTFTLPVATFL